ncbi:MAG: DUF1127 domain-containing protein [Albidovulum sp.]|nr:DUF1127 domain-containing protein [Albidovulum sp.]
MAAIDFHSPVSAFAAFGQRSLYFPAQLTQSFLDWTRTRQTRRELSKLTDHQISDFGLARESIPANRFGSIKN